MANTTIQPPRRDLVFTKSIPDKTRSGVPQESGIRVEVLTNTPNSRLNKFLVEVLLDESIRYNPSRGNLSFSTSFPNVVVASLSTEIFIPSGNLLFSEFSISFVQSGELLPSSGNLVFSTFSPDVVRTGTIQLSGIVNEILLKPDNPETRESDLIVEVLINNFEVRANIIVMEILMTGKNLRPQVLIVAG